MKRLIYFMVLISFQLQAQIDSSNLVKYSPDFNFHDGLFLNFEQVKKNQPIPITRILSTLDYNDINFFKELVEQKEIVAKIEVEEQAIEQCKNLIKIHEEKIVEKIKSIWCEEEAEPEKELAEV